LGCQILLRVVPLAVSLLLEGNFAKGATILGAGVLLNRSYGMGA